MINKDFKDCPCRGALAGLAAIEDELTPPASGAATAAASSAGVPVLRSIAIGVATGLTVWTLTRLIDGRSRHRR